MYDLHSIFDIDEHAKHFIHYLEVIIFPDGHVEYAVPSHQEKLISICCSNLNITRDELNKRCPQEYYFDFLRWLCKVSKCVSVWETMIQFYTLTDEQYYTLQLLKDRGLYLGDIPTGFIV